MGCWVLGKGFGCQSVSVRRNPVGVNSIGSEKVTTQRLCSDTDASLLSAFGQKTGRGHCPEQELIALHPLMINQTWEGPPAHRGHSQHP